MNVSLPLRILMFLPFAANIMIINQCVKQFGAKSILIQFFLLRIVFVLKFPVQYEKQK